MDNSLDQRVLNYFRPPSLIESNRSFELFPIAETEMKIGETLDFILSEPELNIPRTGHLGDWKPIASGRAGALDFNTAICQPRVHSTGHTGSYGRASIYGFTQTESATSALKTGDCVYKPASFIESGIRKELPIQTWNGTEFVRRDRMRSYFCPFVRTSYKGFESALSVFHLKGHETQTNFVFNLEASLLVQNWPRLRSLLIHLLEQCANRPNPRQAYQDLIGHSVSPEGWMQRCELRQAPGGYDLDGEFFESAAAVVDAALIPFLALTDADAVHGQMRELRKRTPLLSNLLVSVLTARLGSHLRCSPESHQGLFQNWHLHWGARDMAGYPPLRRGYYRQKSTLKSLRGICDSFFQFDSSFKPLMFVLLPAAVFMLNPHADSQFDIEALEILFDRIDRASQCGSTSQDRLDQNKRELVEKWFADYRSTLTPYFKNRFVSGSGLADRIPDDGSKPITMPTGFRSLSFRDASLIVGTLTDLQSQYSEQTA